MMRLILLKLVLVQLADTFIDCAVQSLMYGVQKDPNDITKESIARLTDYVKEM